ncbi:MAG: hypothetical protein F2534_02255 [Actinobacteria bacterium]|uniref:Unannotated protein n=1 Tax=freshwater metagenome TaxID=449393 RepID=A0A6J6BWP2_9ZZZZ|nr:hypothetical protein [Actinomycetota bacterium]
MALSADDLRQILSDHGISTVVIGAHAANRYRLEVRSTIDLDLLATTLDGAAEALRAAGCDVRSVSDDGLEYLVCARLGSARVDVLLAETDYQRLAIDRAVDGVLTVEDVIVHKLIAGRPRDLDDIASILAAGVSIDETYVVEHSTSWGVDDRWRLLRDRGR